MVMSCYQNEARSLIWSDLDANVCFKSQSTEALATVKEKVFKLHAPFLSLMVLY
jgi:hypothetical protein